MSTPVLTGELVRPTFPKGGTFLATLRRRVETALDGRARRGEAGLQVKAWICAVWFVASYAGALVAGGTAAQVAFCVSYALAACALGFNVFHDANHGALSADRRVNLWVSRLTCAVLGPSRFLWHQKHHVLHHVYTNVYEWDDDIETRGHLRMSPDQPWKPKYRFQHLYFVVLYAVSTLEWFFVKDIVQYARLRMTHQPIPPMSRADKVEFWVSKAIYVAGFVALPFAFHPPGRVLAGLLLFHVVFGLTLTLVFQIAHGTEQVEFPAPADDDLATMGDEWAVHELRTTVDFAPSNRLVNWFTGGLNFQVEHHLFPQLSHTHYPAVSGVVRATAAEFGVPYHVHPTYWGAVRSHVRFLHAMGRRPGTAT